MYNPLSAAYKLVKIHNTVPEIAVHFLIFVGTFLIGFASSFALL
jgi:hypothetical protein